MTTKSSDWLNCIVFNGDGLVPTIAQDRDTGRVLMMAWQNREALRLTKETGTAVYFSRSRNKLWHKGESSGHTQIVHDIYTDCDGDTVILVVTQLGGIACHTGRESCFFNRLDDAGNWQITDAVIKDPAAIYGDAPKDAHSHTHHATGSHACHHADNSQVSPTKPDHHQVLATLDGILAERKTADKDSSYVASLYHKGLNKILEKVGEEAVESILSARDVQLAQALGQDDGEAKADFIYEVADTWFHQLIALHALDLSSADVLAELARRFGVSGIDEKNSRQQ